MTDDILYRPVLLRDLDLAVYVLGWVFLARDPDQYLHVPVHLDDVNQLNCLLHVRVLLEHPCD